MGFYIVPTRETENHPVLLATIFKTLKQAIAAADREFKYTNFTYDIYSTNLPPFTPDPSYYIEHSRGRKRTGEPLYSSVLPPESNQRTYTESGGSLPKYPHRR